MQLPLERGPLSAGVIDALSGRADLDGDRLVALVHDLPEHVDPITDDDFHVALWVAYELHYLGFEDVAESWEWDPELIRVRRELESVFEAELRRRTADQVRRALEADGDVASRLFDLTEALDGPSLARVIQREATREQLHEFMVDRSI